VASKRVADARRECERLRAYCARLREDVEILRDAVQQHSTVLKVQFQRIAELQAILDEERVVNRKPLTTPRPLFPAALRDSK